jgi:hypothetical protein
MIINDFVRLMKPPLLTGNPMDEAGKNLKNLFDQYRQAVRYESRRNVQGNPKTP